MKELSLCYPEHIAELQRRVASVLSENNLAALIIHSGFPLGLFLDDQHYPFKVNPHFKHWLPLIEHPNCWLVVDGVNKPKLIYYQAQDYWHSTASDVEGFWCEYFDLHFMSNPQDVENFLPAARAHCAYIGDHPELAEALAIGEYNPEAVLHALHYDRAYKTDYEIACITQANHLALKAHEIAKDGFFSGASEYEISMAYLSCLGVLDSAQPYPNIVAINENAAVLHHSALSHQRLCEHKRHSMLIDAGADFAGYAADITRSYAYRKGIFADLVSELDRLQLALVAELKPGHRYTDLHLKCHHLLAKLLLKFGLVTCSASSAVEQGITQVFFPHGLGHHLGLQVHDVGGYMQDRFGATMPPPKEHPYLRCTRRLEARQVLTIEPGLYFIDQLLSGLAKSDAAQSVNWHLVDQLRCFGGIRIEDNVLLSATSSLNLTRGNP